jgi:O-antigen ligase
VIRTNVFIDFFGMLPLHKLSEEDSVFVKEGTARAFGPAQHPIALAVFLIMLVPIAVYLAKHATWPRSPSWRELFWIGCAMLMLLGMISAVSRTAFVSLAVMIVAFVLLKPSGIPRLLLYGILGAAAGLTISARNIIGMITELMDPEALIESQMTSPGWTGSGRLADLGPSLQQAAASPFVGTGLGSRVTTGPTMNAFILDNQYLSTLLESGAIGVLAVAVMLLVPFGRLAAFSRGAAPSPRRDLALAVALGILGYAVALFFFDGFSFIQTLLTFFLLLAIGSWTIAADREPTLLAGRAQDFTR